MYVPILQFSTKWVKLVLVDDEMKGFYNFDNMWDRGVIPTKNLRCFKLFLLSFCWVPQEISQPVKEAITAQIIYRQIWIDQAEGT